VNFRSEKLTPVSKAGLNHEINFSAIATFKFLQLLPENSKRNEFRILKKNSFPFNKNDLFENKR
jgi:hypothetical protein